MATEKQRDDLDLEEHTLEQVKGEFQEVYNAIEQLRIDLVDKIDTDANMRIRDDNYLDKRINDITKEFEKINKQLKSLRDADNKEIKKYLAEINIDKQLQKYDEKRRGDIDKFLNNYTAAITKKIKNIKNQIDLLMKGQLLGSEDEDTEVQPSSDDDGMNVEELQQRVDDILKF